MDRRTSRLGTSGSHLCLLMMTWFCWLLQSKTFNVHWRGSQHEHEVTGMKHLHQLVKEIKMKSRLYLIFLPMNIGSINIVNYYVFVMLVKRENLAVAECT